MPTFSQYFLRLFARWFGSIALLLLAYYVFVFLMMKEAFFITPLSFADFLVVALFCVFGFIVAVIPAGLFSVIHAAIGYQKITEKQHNSAAIDHKGPVGSHAPTKFAKKVE